MHIYWWTQIFFSQTQTTGSLQNLLTSALYCLRLWKIMFNNGVFLVDTFFHVPFLLYHTVIHQMFVYFCMRYISFIPWLYFKQFEKLKLGDKGIRMKMFLCFSQPKNYVLTKNTLFFLFNYQLFELLIPLLPFLFSYEMAHGCSQMGNS